MSAVQLLAELEAVTAELLGAAHAADPLRLEQLGVRREALVRALGKLPGAPAHVPALRRILGLDAAVRQALAARRRDLAAELEVLGRGRRALRSYRGAAGVLPVLDAAG
jgi:hypothetical protein